MNKDSVTVYQNPFEFAKATSFLFLSKHENCFLARSLIIFNPSSMSTLSFSYRYLTASARAFSFELYFISLSVNSAFSVTRKSSTVNSYCCRLVNVSSSFGIILSSVSIISFSWRWTSCTRYISPFIFYLLS